MRRRALLAGAATLPLVGCSRTPPTTYDGGWVGANAALGHRLRTAGGADRKAAGWPTPAVHRRASVLVVGAGIAGLAAARALVRAGIDDMRLFDLEAEAGGNSRGHAIAGMACPLGAHYLPLPGDDAVEVIELLESLGLRTLAQGRPVYDERHLCHSPQERLHIAGHWREGLLPPLDALPAVQRDRTARQYRAFSTAVDAAATDHAFAMPTARSRWSAALAALDGQTFAHWLDAQGLDAPALRWYLNHCCRDDYGAGAAQVSAWAGLHYFASRHGFHPPGDDARPETEPERDAVLTWPEGNAFLARRMAAPLAGRTSTGCLVHRVAETLSGIELDLWNETEQHGERWTAAHAVLAVPLFVAARLLDAPPAALADAVRTARHAPWLVGNLHLDSPLDDRPGAASAWDNVVYGEAALGYVDAMHQSTRAVPGPTVLTTYWALGGNTPTELAAQRARLLAEPWSAWAATVVQPLAAVHPDLPARLRRVDLMRYGHAMSVPVPGLRSSAALLALAAAQRRIHFAHADLSGYSVFEEALFHGTRAAKAVRGARFREGRSAAGKPV